MLRESLYIATRIRGSAVNVSSNSPNILDLTKGDFFQLNLSQTHGKIG